MNDGSYEATMSERFQQRFGSTEMTKEEVANFRCMQWASFLGEDDVDIPWYDYDAKPPSFLHGDNYETINQEKHHQSQE
jgi:hypothetical protein